MKFLVTCALALLFAGCHTVVKGNLELDKELVVTDLQGKTQRYAPGDYGVTADISSGTVKFSVEQKKKSTEFEFTGSFGKPKPGPIDVLVENNKASYRFKGEYTHSETLLGKGRDTLSCVRNGSPGHSFVFYDEYEVKEYIDAHLYVSNDSEPIGHLIMDRTKKTRVTVNESGCF